MGLLDFGGTSAQAIKKYMQGSGDFSKITPSANGGIDWLKVGIIGLVVVVLIDFILN